MKAMWAILPEEMPNSRARDYVGLPPELTGGIDHRQLLPMARYLILLEMPDGYWMVFRYAEDLSFVNDTWHQTMDDAYSQVQFDFPDAVLEWRDIPFSGAHDLSTWTTGCIEWVHSKVAADRDS